MRLIAASCFSIVFHVKDTKRTKDSQRWQMKPTWPRAPVCVRVHASGRGRARPGEEAGRRGDAAASCRAGHRGMERQIGIERMQREGYKRRASEARLTQGRMNCCGLLFLLMPQFFLIGLFQRLLPVDNSALIPCMPESWNEV